MMMRRRMIWRMILVFTLCCVDISATKKPKKPKPSEIENHENMRRNWFDSVRYKKIKISREEEAYFLKNFSVQVSVPLLARSSAVAPRIRQECRTLSDAKRQLLFNAFKWMFTTRLTTNGLTRYQIFQSQHRFTSAPGAHFGPCFLPWHRVFLTRFEKALQEFDSTLTLCYWDSSLDSSLPDSSDSCLWTDEYFGNGDGDVTSGFAANQKAYPPDCADQFPVLSRDTGGNYLLFNEAKINNTVLKYTSFTDLERPWTSNDFERYHGSVHGYVGGLMSLVSCSVADPVFWFHHTYIDYLFEVFRRRQTTDKLTDYPNDSSVPAFHKANDTMLPFTGRCIDGLGNNFIPSLYDYAPSPGVCTNHADCGGKALWCNNRRCMACVGPGGAMLAGWPKEACYITGCIAPENLNNVCTCKGP